MEWNQTIPLHSGSYIIFQIGAHFLLLIKIETTAHWCTWVTPGPRFGEVSASVKPAESSCGLASSQQFSGHLFQQTALEHSGISSPILSSPIPQAQPIVIESNIYSQK